MKESVRIQDNLYEAINGEWMKKVKIPNDLPVTGGFMTLNDEVEKTLMADFELFAKGELGSDIIGMADAVRLYQKAMDDKVRDEAGMKPLFPLLEKIKNIKDIKELNSMSGELALLGVRLPINVEIVEDFKDTSKYCFGIMDPDIILPDTTYYGNKILAKMMLSLYAKGVKKLLKLAPLSKNEQKQYLKDTIAFDDLLRQKVKSQMELANYIALYNPMDLDELTKQLKPFDIKALLKQLYNDTIPEGVVYGASNPRLIEGFKEIFNENTFELYKHWAYVNAILGHARALSLKIGEIAGDYMRALMGIKKAPEKAKRVYRLISSIYSEPIGVYYGRKYFGEEAKADIRSIVEKIIETYKGRMKRNTFLKEETKEKAILKLSKLKIKVGYPDDVDPFYKSLVVNEEDTYFDAMMNIYKLQKQHNFNKLLKKTNPKEWAMPGHMVNACYDPFKNDITFPAAILQKPFYDLHQTVSENLGGIGAVIGHEISHAFDNNGSHLDEHGNLNDWWHAEDFKEFEKLTELMVQQFDGLETPAGKANGRLIVSENIADNGGMGVTLEIMHTVKDADFKLYFTNWAKIWCSKAKPKYEKLLLTNDVHGPKLLRTNIPPRNFQEWYDAFDVKETDKMYLPEDKRLSIW